MATLVFMGSLLSGQSIPLSDEQAPNPTRSFEARAEQMPDASRYQILSKVKNTDLPLYADNVLVAAEEMV